MIMLFGILEINTRIAIEALLDVGLFIIASMGWEPPTSYREVARILDMHGVLDQREARILEGLARLRNLIIHAYADIDYKIMLEAVDDINVLEHIMGRMLDFIGQAGLDP